MTAPKPVEPRPGTHTFETCLRWQDEKLGALQTQGADLLPVSGPKEFGGRGTEWSPETLLLGAAEACTMLTFLAYAERRGLRVLAYTSHATGLMGRGEDGKMRFLEVAIRPTVEVATRDEIVQVEEAFARIEGKCFIGNSLTAEPTRPY